MTETAAPDSTGGECTLLHLEIRPGTEAEYARRHDEIWPEMVAAIRSSGISELRIFRHDRSISIYAVCRPDAETAFARLGQTDVNERWNQHMADVLVDRSAAIFSPQVWVME
jgi:L-rhamnose mutarotase